MPRIPGAVDADMGKVGEVEIVHDGAGDAGELDDLDDGEDVGPACLHDAVEPCGCRLFIRAGQAASSASAWERRKLTQVVDVRSGAGSIPACCRISHTVEAATLIPSTSSSPWMRR